MKKIIIEVSGMHCRSCELILEKSLKKIENVDHVVADEKQGTIEISYTNTPPNQDSINAVILENGYSIGKNKVLPWVSKNPDDYARVILTTLIVFVCIMILSHLNLGLPSVGSSSSPTLAIALLIGLTAGVSSCMALIGGLVLGISAEWNKLHAKASLKARLAPHIYFHLGRVLGFGFFGGLLGAFGSIITFSNIFLGLMTVLVGVIMLILGLNLTNLSPRIGSFSPTLPKFLGKNIKGESSTKIATMLTGAATFFLPCGFTLAMQVYAVSTGSFMTGALALSFFAIGTIPGLLSLGFVSAIFKGVWLKRFFVFTGVIILGLSLYNLHNGYVLLSLGAPKGQEIPQNQEITNTNTEIQEVRMTQKGNGYTPNTLTLQAGKKIRWIITSTNPYSCASQIMVPSLGISQQLEEGENIIEFVAPESGEIPFSCSMGMYRGTFIVE